MVRTPRQFELRRIRLPILLLTAMIGCATPRGAEPAKPRASETDHSPPTAVITPLPPIGPSEDVSRSVPPTLALPSAAPTSVPPSFAPIQLAAAEQELGIAQP